ncbi:MAG: polyhydroxyalkanoate depolymerase [Thermococci archaeon]|nr:polyhydroxyalkanoate depolymerase [Thermococci archaeon]
MFVGDVDTGKSTSLIYVANRLMEEGRSVAIVDSDVGQKGILPPATVSLAVPDEPFSSLSELKCEACYFIGTTSPGQYMGEMAVGTWRLTSRGRKLADFVLLDTTGFVYGRGAEMKRLKVELIRPDVAVFLEREDELEHLKSMVGHLTRTVELRVSENAREHSREDRRDVRMRKWRRYFAASGELVLRDVTVTGTSLFHGRRLGAAERELLERIYGWIVFEGWRDPKGCYHVVKAGKPFAPLHRGCLHAVDVEKLSNLLVGLIDRDGLCLSVGILKVPGLGGGALQVLTPLGDEEVSKVTEVRLGRIRVTEEGEEIELLRRDEL